MQYRRPPRSMIMTLGQNLRSFYSSIYIDVEERLENLLEESSSSGTMSKITSEYKEIESKSSFSLYTSDLTKEVPGYDTVKEGQVFFLKNEEDSLIYVFANRNKKFLRSVVFPFFYDEYPDIFHLTYASRELRDVLHYIEDFLGTKLFSERASAKRIFGEDAETRVEYKQGEHPPFKLVFDKAREDELWIDWIRVRTEEDLSYNFSLSREGRFRFISGNISKFMRILQKFGEIGLEKHKLLSNREIREDKEPKPLLLKYKSEVFSEKKHRKGLIETFSDYKRCSYSVIHKGNPHVYMYVSDKMDDSSYSIRNVGNSKLMITPQTSSSSAAFMRLIDFLSGNFMEPSEVEEM